MNLSSMQDFQKLDIRVGKIIEVHSFPEAKKPAYKLTIDFGAEIGIKKSSAQITENYTQEQLLNQQVLCVVNFPPRQIGSFMSQVLTLGVPSKDNTVVLIQPQKDVPVGVKLY